MFHRFIACLLLAHRLSEVPVKSAELEKTDRVALLFRAAQEQQKGIILILEGTGLAGLVHTVDELSSCLDPRHFQVHHFPGYETAPERKDPFLHHYWMHLPRYGDLALFDGSYYHEFVRRVLKGKLSRDEKKAWIDDINRFEESLQANYYLVLKVRLNRHGKDLEDELKSDKKLKSRAALIRKRARYLVKEYRDYSQELDRLTQLTGSPLSPWFTPPEGKGKQVRSLVLDYIIARMEEFLSVDSRQAVASYDEAMKLMRKLNRERNTVRGESEEEIERSEES
ncbi:MAG TPA: hypothetical protein DEA96_01600 [Leptospiraceae bacterium]|nr:hypothetical protein [Spirochaetaceae bacterium]HBS03628.1 hypothetical protein [Leptospiraceae bacterium]